MFNDETEKAAELQNLNDLTEDEAPVKPDEKTTEKKKKVKRISMIKLKASDMAGLSTHQFQQTGNFEADQRELHKIVMKLKADKTARERSGKTEEKITSTSNTSRPRSQSKIRSRTVGDCEISDGIHQRSRSTSRSSGAEVVDLTPEKCSKSVTRRSRSVARKDGSGNCTGTGNASQPAEETKRSGTRGRSVGSKRISGTSGRDPPGREASEQSININRKVRERSRSVARQRISDVDNYDADGDDDQLQHRTHNIVDLSTGLAFVDRETRSRSVARTRPGEEEAAANFEDLMTSHRSLGSRSKNSSTSKSDVSSGKEKLRCISVGRKVRSSDEKSPHQLSSKGVTIISAVDKEKRRSKSTGRTVKSVDKTVSSDKGEGNGKESLDSRDHINTGKAIPWNEFLKHAQSGQIASVP